MAHKKLEAPKQVRTREELDKSMNDYVNEPGIAVAEPPLVLHCCNCMRSTATEKSTNPLVCNYKKAIFQVGKEAGKDGAALGCNYFMPKDHFSTAGLQ